MTTTSTITTERGGAYVHANGIDIHYVDQGQGDPLVLLHGGMVSTGPAWDGAPVSYVQHMDRFAQHFRVIAPDARAAGATVHDGGAISLSLLADDVLALIDALGLDRPLVCGFSQGGATATVLSIRNPGVVRAVVNDAGFDMFDPESQSFAMLRTMLGGDPEATRADPDAAVAVMEQHGMGAMVELMKADHDGAQGEGYWRRYLELNFEAATRFPGYGFGDLAAIEAPTLVLAGDRDMFCSVEDAVRAYRSIPGAELAIIPGHDHSIKESKVDATLEFLRRHAEA